MKGFFIGEIKGVLLGKVGKGEGLVGKLRGTLEWGNDSFPLFRSPKSKNV